MKLIRGLINISAKHKGAVATIGNFDGFHRGHQQLLNTALTKAKELNAPSLLILFEPQPSEYFSKKAPPARLMTLREKLAVLKGSGIDYVLCLRFNAQFLAWTAEKFIQILLIDKLAIKHLIVGDDFRFGAERKGDFTLLKEAAAFPVESLETVKTEETRVSSHLIRQLLATAQFAAAEKLLTRPYSMSGRVIHGNKLGRELGCPTANILPARRQVPFTGIYAVKVSGISGSLLPGVASLGTRPTVDGTKELLEVHLLDFDQDIYGKILTVHFFKKLRDEERFDSLEELKEQIAKDVLASREFLANDKNYE